MAQSTCNADKRVDSENSDQTVPLLAFGVSDLVHVLLKPTSLAAETSMTEVFDLITSAANEIDADQTSLQFILWSLKY